MSGQTSEMRQSGMTFQRAPRGMFVIVLLAVLAAVIAATVVSANRRESAAAIRAATSANLASAPVSEAERFSSEWYAWYLSNAKANLASAPVSEAERFSSEWYAWYLGNAKADLVIPPTGTSYFNQPHVLSTMATEPGGDSDLVIPPMGTSYFNQPHVLSTMATELDGVSGSSIPTEAERFTTEWYEWYKSLAPADESGTTLDLHDVAPNLDANPADDADAFYTEKYWKQAAEYDQLESAAPEEWAYYTERYWAQQR